VVAHELLVEAWLGAAGLVCVFGPEAGGVRREDFVDEDERAVAGDTELELRVGDDDAPRCRVLDAAFVDRDRQVAQPGGAIGADDRGGLRLADVLVVARLGLRRRREDRRRQLV